MKNLGHKILFYLKYTLYFMVTVQDRDNYHRAEMKGYHCTGSRDDSYILYGSARLYTFDPTKLPTKNYLTFKQYKKQYYPWK